MKYIVKDWYRVEWQGEWLEGGDEFEGDPETVVAEGLAQYVTPVPEDPEPEEAPAKAKPAASNKARKDSPNK